MIDDALRVFKTEGYSRFQNFDDALEELTLRLNLPTRYNKIQRLTKSANSS